MPNARRTPAPAWRRPGALALVFFGGILGAGAREALELVLPSAGGVPVATLIANVVGAFALGWLLERTAPVRRRPAMAAAQHPIAPLRPSWERLRLFAGAGVLGGFTTYSGLAVTTAALAAGGHVWLAVAYGLGTVALGALAGFGGVAGAIVSLDRARGLAGHQTPDSAPERTGASDA